MPSTFHISPDTTHWLCGQVLDLLDTGVMVLDEKRAVCIVNMAALEILNKGADAVLGRTCRELLHPDKPRCRDDEQKACVILDDDFGVDGGVLVVHKQLPDGRSVLFLQPAVSLEAQLQRVSDERDRLARRIDAAFGAETLICICSMCRKVRHKDGSWVQPEVVREPSLDDKFTHGFCPACASQLMEEWSRAHGRKSQQTSEAE